MPGFDELFAITDAAILFQDLKHYNDLRKFYYPGICICVFRIIAPPSVMTAAVCGS